MFPFSRIRKQHGEHSVDQLSLRKITDGKQLPLLSWRNDTLHEEYWGEASRIWTWNDLRRMLHEMVYIYIYMCVCVCACVWFCLFDVFSVSPGAMWRQWIQHHWHGIHHVCLRTQPEEAFTRPVPAGAATWPDLVMNLSKKRRIMLRYIEVLHFFWREIQLLMTVDVLDFFFEEETSCNLNLRWLPWDLPRSHYSRSRSWSIMAIPRSSSSWSTCWTGRTSSSGSKCCGGMGGMWPWGLGLGHFYSFW